jgi:hypothetical protein
MVEQHDHRVWRPHHSASLSRVSNTQKVVQGEYQEGKRDSTGSGRNDNGILCFRRELDVFLEECTEVLICNGLITQHLPMD